ncbi:hypothetical protein CPB83DRAFT_853201 [Crepidotus variabilis]|uniref:Histone-lysine N-methyltransferase SET5 n=1 Tax=Crepidotus variabilis TaxID=179855 RepID=A0A9P6EHD3_9AGAR|nr:hypothetical protein CPB83DRAFT_853201 [Crepidotus variabilis]
MSTPSEAELTEALIELKARDPSLGISKIHVQLLEHYPEWVVSEKRTRKILQANGLTLAHHATNGGTGEKDLSTVPKIPLVPKYTSKEYVPPGPGTTREPLPPLEYPKSKLMKDLDVHQWSPKVTVKWFDAKRGKGLVATEEIEEGEIIWKEDPWVVAPEWEILDLQLTSAACGYCTTPLSPSSPLLIPCPSSSSTSFSSSSSSKGASQTCPMRFCNRLCQARSSKVHPLLCPSQNPASIPFLKYARDCHWMALHALAHVTSRILLVNQRSEEALRAEWEAVTSWAVLGMRERVKFSYMGSAEPDRVVWEKGHLLYRQAFKEPKTPLEQKKLAKLLKKPLPENVDTGLFDYEVGFLQMLGKMNLNMEAHGGIYTLHSHLNHGCNPNTSVRHLDQRTLLSRITVLAKRAIKPNEELVITYVNPKLGYKARREELRAWGFGKCKCERCTEEERVALASFRKGGKSVDNAEGEVEREDRERRVQEELDDMVRELKANLGVV